ncbi:related to DNA-directed RNA polymerase I A12.2 subunit [Cephalotrichum gorgonifer]|uniref:DNA-directed RNA polymerase subunit n=1 Tax=Cephalotrichum gorgonifer TaxID=2041049 RepID=A0AAE8SSF9_9PEZI|nr:related to DNA-directed RNA polymerase I A12.2 subunit [Cephalotrichum gorgonifer]
MTTIASLVFCTACGTLLPESIGNTRNLLKCDCCTLENRDVGINKTTAVTKPTDFPSVLRQKLHSSVKAVEKHKIDTMAKTDEKCPKCGAEEVRFTTLQLRSADEGTTVFFYCDCGYTWNANN